MKTLTHIAIIPDGNRRWAKNHSLATAKGHEEGFEALRSILKRGKELDIKTLSFYAFSTENFNRTQTEVQQLFSLLENVLDKFSRELKENHIQLRISGSRERLSSNLLKKLDDAMELCAEGEFILNICFNYGAQEEFTHIAKNIAKNVANGKLSENDISEEYIQSQLWNGDLPPVDLLIRTSGEYRISNFMLWQCAYAEFYFSPKLWPDFNFEDLLTAIQEYNNRQRRYGV